MKVLKTLGSLLQRYWANRKIGPVSKQEGVTILWGLCPDCFVVLLGGPEGGLNQNLLCPRCHQEFLAAPVPEWCERMGIASEDRQEFYRAIGARPVEVLTDLLTATRRGV